MTSHPVSQHGSVWTSCRPYPFLVQGLRSCCCCCTLKVAAGKTVLMPPEATRDNATISRLNTSTKQCGYCRNSLCWTRACTSGVSHGKYVSATAHVYGVTCFVMLIVWSRLSVKVITPAHIHQDGLHDIGYVLWHRICIKSWWSQWGFHLIRGFRSNIEWCLCFLWIRDCWAAGGGGGTHLSAGGMAAEVWLVLVGVSPGITAWGPAACSASRLKTSLSFTTSSSLRRHHTVCVLCGREKMKAS